jgi:glycerol uptake facilitator-like aquaporin
LGVIIGLWLNKEIESRKALGYLAVQFFGGIVAALTLAAVLGETSNLGQTTLAPEVSVWQGLLVETLLTFFLVNTIFNTASAERQD